MASLLMVKGPTPGEQIELVRDKMVLGRNPECDIVIAGPAVSREHAQILRVNNQFFVKDLESRNKTRLNDEEIKPNIPIRLSDKDQLKICDFEFTFLEKPPLPPGLAPEDIEEEDEGGSTVMSTIEAGTSNQALLQTQPSEVLQKIIEITNSLSRTLELEPLLPKIIDNLFQIFKQADRGFIVVREEPSGRLIPKAIRTRREKDESTARFSRKIVNQCIDEGQAFLSEDALMDDRVRMSQSISDFRIRSVICAPLRGGEGTVFGVIQLDTQERNKKFTQADLSLLVAVSNQAAVAMENAKLHEDVLHRDRFERESKLAGEVQHVLLPSRMPEVAGYEFFAHYKAASHVGGDFYTFVPLPQGRVAVAIGDVAGKGIPAALLMARLTSDVNYYMLAESDPAVAVTKLNAMLGRAGLGDRFVTFALLLVDPAQHTLQIVNAGHISPIIRRAATDMLEEVAGGDKTGLPLGVLEDYPYESCVVQLQAGDSVTLCTDGILDAMNTKDEAYGSERLLSSIKSFNQSPENLARQLIKSVEMHSAGRTSQHDDITLVCFGRVR